jgi:hypothetical protein
LYLDISQLYKERDMITTALFWFQIVMAWLYTVPQVIALVNGRTEGLNLTIYVVYMAYIILSFLLAVASYRQVIELARKQVVVIFLQWMICIALILVVGFSKITWSKGDSVITSIIVLLSFVTILEYRGIKDAYSKAFINVWCKSVPQLWLAGTIYIAQSGDGLPLLTLIAGHLTALPRLVQVVISGLKGWDKPTRGLLIGESANVATWIVVTVVWIYYQV